MAINLKRKFSQFAQKESVPYSDENGSLINWLDNDNVTREGNQFNGVSQLVKTDSNGKIPESIIPNLALTETFVVDATQEMLQLKNVRIGDICIVIDENVTYVLRSEPSSVLSNWSEIKVRETPIFNGSTSSTNGQKGLVPQPLAGQQNSYLKGDGTWFDIGSVLHSDLNNIEEDGLLTIKDAALEVCADKDLNNLSQTGSYKLVPSGGDVNYILAKKSSNTGDFGWLKANLEGCLYDSYSIVLTEDTDSLNLPAIFTNKKYITVCLDNVMLLGSNYELSEDGTMLLFNETITASEQNPSEIELKYFTSVSVLEQLEQATTTYKGKIALATQEEVNAGTNNDKAVTPLTLNNVIDIAISTNNVTLENQINSKISSTEKGVANGIATLNANLKVPSSQIDTVGILSLIDINTLLQKVDGFDATKTQVLKNINGTFTWVEETTEVAE